jgi:hypothetical protein
MLILNGLIGVGGFGKVLTAKYDVTQQWHAVKEIAKVAIANSSLVCVFMGIFFSRSSWSSTRPELLCLLAS